MEILLVIKNLDKIYQKKNSHFPNFWAKIGLFLIMVLRKVVRYNGIVFSTILAKDLLLTGKYMDGPE